MNVLNIGHQKTIVENDAGVIGISYSTSVLFKPAGYSVLFVSSTYYSVTTAKHKAILARYISHARSVDINAGALIDLINQDLDPEVVLQEVQQKAAIIAAIEENQESGVFFSDKNLYNYVEKGTRKRTNYKNGNFQDVQLYRTNFKYVPNLDIKQTRHAFKERLTTGNSKPGKASKGATYYRYKYKVVVRSYSL